MITPRAVGKTPLVAPAPKGGNRGTGDRVSCSRPPLPGGYLHYGLDKTGGRLSVSCHMVLG